VTASPADARIVAYGESAVLITLGDRIDRATNARVHDLAAAVRSLAQSDARFGSPVPAYASLLVPIDPLALGTDAAIERLADIVAAVPPSRSTEAAAGPLVDLATRYGGADGPDLADVAALHDLTEADVIELHASVEYHVFFLGFAPGFAYLGTVPEAIATPRRATPRTRVPAGSVGLAGDQTGVYPFEMPGGWQLIGRTGARLWDLARPSPALLAPGARVRFVPRATGR